MEGSFEDNMRALSHDVSDMELVLFDTPEHSNIPSEDEIYRLSALREELGMTCTVHFPADLCTTVLPVERTELEDRCLRTVELFSPLEPFAWILHVCGEIRGVRPSGDMREWQELTAQSLSRLKERSGAAEKICVETLDYDFSYIYDIVRALGFSICLDIGHLVKYGYPAAELSKKYMPMAKVLHIHGVRPDGTDHVGMEYFDKGLFREVSEIISDGDGMERVMTLEVFEEDYFTSLKTVRELLI